MNRKIGWLGWMKNRFAKDVHHVGLFVMDILIAILCFVMVFALWFMVYSFVEDRDRGYDAYSLQMSLNNGNYQKLLEKSNVNRAMGVGIGDPDYEEYYGVADYFEALMRYHMYDKAGDEAAAATWQERMEDAESRMGSLSGEKESLKQMFQILIDSSAEAERGV